MEIRKHELGRQRRSADHFTDEKPRTNAPLHGELRLIFLAAEHPGDEHLPMAELLTTDRISTSLAVLMAIIALWQFFRAAKATRKLKEAEDWADGPMWSPSAEKFNGLEFYYTPTKGHYYPAGASPLLCWMREEVDPSTEKGTTVLLVLKNSGEPFRTLRIQTRDGPSTELVTVQSQGRSIYALAYGFNPAQLGHEHVLEMTFRSQKGFKRTHRYRMIHGRRVFHRIEPAMI